MNTRLFFGLAVISLFGDANAQDAGKTLARLDAASAHFASAQASFHKDLYNDLIKDVTPQDGTLYVQGKGGSARGGLRIVGPGARTMEYRNGVARVFNPALGCYDTVTAKNKSVVESFLTLGFGGSGKDLANSWTINDQGSEILSSDGRKVQVEKLDLVPKDPNVKGMVTHVTLWLDLDRAISLKQVFYSPSGDTQTAVYSDVRLNTKVDTKPYDFKGSPCGK